MSCLRNGQRNLYMRVYYSDGVGWGWGSFGGWVGGCGCVWVGTWVGPWVDESLGVWVGGHVGDENDPESSWSLTSEWSSPTGRSNHSFLMHRQHQTPSVNAKHQTPSVSTKHKAPSVKCQHQAPFHRPGQTVLLLFSDN